MTRTDLLLIDRNECPPFRVEIEIYYQFTLLREPQQQQQQQKTPTEFF